MSFINCFKEKAKKLRGGAEVFESCRIISNVTQLLLLNVFRIVSTTKS